MLKFQDNYSIEIENMEDLFLISHGNQVSNKEI